MVRPAILILSLLSFSALPCPGQSRQTVDLLLIEHPLALRIYNRYQQEITPEEAGAFRPFAPMEIIKPDELLSDHFTRALVVRVGQQTFYVLKTGRQSLMNAGEAGQTTTLARCAALSDTIRVLQDMRLSYTPSSAGGENTATGGTLIRRLYRSNGRDYVTSLSGAGGYGWGRFDAGTRGKSWDTPDRRTVSGAAVPETLRQGTAQRLDEVNRALRDLFDLLNRQTGQSRPAPQWRMTLSGDRIVCALNDPFYAAQFAESARYLVNNLDEMARRSGYALTYADGVITLRKTR